MTKTEKLVLERETEFDGLIDQMVQALNEATFKQKEIVTSSFQIPEGWK